MAKYSDAVLQSNNEHVGLFEFCGHNQTEASYFGQPYENFFVDLFMFILAGFSSIIVVTTEANMIQWTPSASHLESPHMGEQSDINFMVHGNNRPCGLDNRRSNFVPCKVCLPIPRMSSSNYGVADSLYISCLRKTLHLSTELVSWFF